MPLWQGVLSVEELKTVLTRPVGGKRALSDKDVERLVQTFDKNGDGVLQYDEFAPLWADLSGGSVVEVSGGGAVDLA